MGYLTEEQAINRDGSGNLLTDTITLEFWPDEFDGQNKLLEKPDIKYVPISKGELKQIFSASKKGKTSKDQDESIIVEHCKHPTFTPEKLNQMSIAKINSILTAIFAGSIGKSQTETKKVIDIDVTKLSELDKESAEKKT